ncbi:MAG: O-antigen ligase family protein [Acidobacteriota bacterium]|nr:O-antigen ligase family protein [Acidobacteriota bacterium]
MILYYILVLSLPFLSHPLFGLKVGPLTVEKYLGAICFLYAVLHAAVRRRAPGLFRTTQARAFLLFFLLASISWLALGRSLTATTMLDVYGSHLLFLVTTVALIDSLPRLRWALVTAVAAMGLVSLYVIRDWQLGSAVYGASYRPGYVAGDANFFTASVLLSLPVALLLLWNERSAAVRIFCFGSLLVTLAAITLAASRGGFLGLLVAMGWLLWRSRTRFRNLVLVGAALGLLLAISPLSPVARFLHPDYSDTDSVRIHLALWRAGLRIVRDHPLTGIGVGQFKAAVGEYSSEKDLSLLAHNTYLEIAAEMGLGGLGLFLVIFGSSFRTLTRVRLAAERHGPPLLRVAATGIQAGLLGFGVAAFFVSAEFLRMFWFMLFLSICLLALEQEEAARVAAAEGRPSTAEAARAEWWTGAEAGNDAW